METRNNILNCTSDLAQCSLVIIINKRREHKYTRYLRENKSRT